MKRDHEIGKGEANTRRRKRRQVYVYCFALLVGVALGVILAMVERGEGNFVSGDIANLSLEPWVALAMVAATVFAMLILPAWWMGEIDELLREEQLISAYGGCLAVLTGYPVWMMLYAGGFTELPHALGMFLLALFGALATYAYTKIRNRT